MVVVSLGSGSVIVTVLSIFVWIVFLISYAEGLNDPWYNSLKFNELNVWIPRVLWIVSTIVAYTALFFIYSSTSYDQTLLIGVLYIIGAFLNILWSVSLFELNDLGLAFWASVVLFLYQLWVFIFIFYLEPLLSLFLIPSVVMYFYLVYTMINTSLLNDIPL